MTLQMDWTNPSCVEKYDDKYVKELQNFTPVHMEEVMRSRGKNIDGEDTSVKEQYKKIKAIVSSIYTEKEREVFYKHSKKNPNDGRLYADRPSLQGLMGCFRGVLSGSSSIDFDMVNAHPTILLHLAFKYKFADISKLSEYVNNREAILKQLQNDEGISRGESKTLILCAINKENLTTKKSNKKVIKSKWFIEFDKEIKTLQQAFSNLFPTIVKEVRRNGSNNVLGRMMARILNIEENIILQDAYNSISSQVKVMSLVFDGLMTYKQDHNGNDVDEEEIINTLDNATVRWGVKWSVKAPDLSLVPYLEDMDIGDNPVQIGRAHV